MEQNLTMLPVVSDLALKFKNCFSFNFKPCNLPISLASIIAKLNISI